MVRNALPNSDLVQFHQQEGECGEVSFRDKSTNEMKHRRFIIVNKNIVLIERRQVDQNILTFHGGMHVEIILGKERIFIKILI